MRPSLIPVAFLVTASLLSQGNISSLSPANTAAGGPAFTLTLNGTGFNVFNVVQWDSGNVPTTFVSTTQLQASIPASFITTIGSHNVRVKLGLNLPGLSNTVVFNVVNPVPVVTTMAPSFCQFGAGGFTLQLVGSSFVATSFMQWNGVPLTTTVVSSTTLTAPIAGSLVTTPGTAAVTVVNPVPGGGLSNAVLFIINPNPVPTITNVTPLSATIGTNLVVLNYTGTGFTPSTIARLGGTDLITNFLSPTHVQGLVFASMISVPGQLSLSVFTPSPGGGTATFGSFSVNNPAPLIGSLNGGFPLTGGGGTPIITVTGSGFMPTTAWSTAGVALQATFNSESDAFLTIPSVLLRETGTYQVTATNPGPGGGSDTLPIHVAGPLISFCSPPIIPVLAIASPPVTLTVTGVQAAPFVIGDQIHFDGVPRATAFVNTTTLTCTVDGTVPGALHVGGFAVTVTRQGSAAPVVSNAVGVTVGSGGTPDNAGTVTLVPVPPSPGVPFNVRVEIPVGVSAVTLLAQAPAPAPILVSFGSGFDLVIGPGLGAPIVLADGLGIFGPPTGAASVPQDLSFFNVTTGQGVFSVSNLFAPPTLGITVSLVAVYSHPLSPIGLGTTHVSGPYTF
jgi:hypothetical protein